MKGVSHGIELLGKILIIVFIVGLMAIVLFQFLPAYSEDACRQEQTKDMNDLINDAVSGVQSKTLRNFEVLGTCVEYINFDCLKDEKPCKGIYAVRYVGEKDDLFVDLPGGSNLLEISCPNCMEDGKQIDKLVKGDYLVEISSYAIKFTKKEN